MRKLMAAVLCAALAVPALFGGASAESSATAVNVAVLQYEGTVNVTSQAGKAIPVFNNMKLHGGYEVATGAESYAWMSLDDTKVAGLDADSNMAVEKQGRLLVLLLDQGNMFFDVQQKLEEDETMNIRTSNMVMGIRGTFGVVRAADSGTTQVLCLDGTLEIRAFDPVTGASLALELKPGETAEFHADPASAEPVSARVRAYEPEEIDGFVLRYLNRNRGTAERILASGGGDLAAAAEGWQDRLTADEAEKAAAAAGSEAGDPARETEQISYWQQSAPCAAGHDYRDAGTVPPTCVSAGSCTHMCIRCGTISVTEIPPTGIHSYVRGYCTVCGAADPGYVPGDSG